MMLALAFTTTACDCGDELGDMAGNTEKACKPKGMKLTRDVSAQGNAGNGEHPVFDEHPGQGDDKRNQNPGAKQGSGDFPETVIAVDFGKNEADLTWNPIADAAYYQGIVSTDSECNTHTLASPSLTEPRWVIPNLSSVLPDGTYYLCIWAYNSSGRKIAKTKPSIEFIVDTQPPPELALWLAAYSDTIGNVRLTIKLPSNIADYDSANLYRSGPGESAPACGQGEPVLAFSEMIADRQWDHEDVTPMAGVPYSYRFCVTDKVGNRTQQTLAGASSTLIQHRMALSGVVSSGSVQGVEGADSVCRTEFADPYAKAIISDEWVDARDRVVIRGPVRNTATGEAAAVVHRNYDGLFAAGALTASVAYSAAAGEAITDDLTAWTGSNTSGQRIVGQTCFGWQSSASASARGQFGDAAATDATWASKDVSFCNQQRRLYCITQAPTPRLDEFRVTAEVAPGRPSLYIRFPAALGDLGRVEIRRRLGASHVDGGCRDSQDAIVKTYDLPMLTALAGAADDILDEPGVVGRFSYRACVFDIRGDLASSMDAGSVKVGSFYEMFVTSAKFSGQRGGSAGADADCAVAAATAGLSGTWTAFISAAGSNASSRYGASQQAYPIFDLAGGMILGNATAIFTQDLLLPIFRDEFGRDITAADANAERRVWTGTETTGVLSGNSCSSWSATTGNGTIGVAKPDASFTGPTIPRGLWLNRGATGVSCGLTLRLYCYGQ